MSHVVHKKVEVLSDDELIITFIDKIWIVIFNNTEKHVGYNFLFPLFFIVCRKQTND